MIPEKLGNHSLQHRHNSLLPSKTVKRSLLFSGETNGREQHSTNSSNGDGSKLRRSRRRRYSRENAYSRAVICGTVAFIIVALFVFHAIGRSRDSGRGSSLIQKLKDTRRQRGSSSMDRRRQQRRRHDNIIPNNPNYGELDHKGMEERAQKRKKQYQSLYKHKYDATILGYDVYNCPSTPPNNYPMSWTVTEVLTNWPPLHVTTTTTTNTSLPPLFHAVHHGLCIFDHATQYDTALIYRNAELPFILQNDPAVLSTARKWSDNTDYLYTMLSGDGSTTKYRIERSPINYFIWYRLQQNSNHHHHYNNRNNNHFKMKKEDVGNKAAVVATKQRRHGVATRKIIPDDHGNTNKDFVQPANDESEMTFGEWLELAIYKDAIALNDEDMLVKAQTLHERRMMIATTTNTLQKLVEGDDDITTTTTTNADVNDEDHESEESKRNKYYYLRLNAALQHPFNNNNDPTSSSIENFIYDELPFLDPRYPEKSEFYCVDPKHHRGINCRFGMRGVIAANHFDMSRNTIVVLGGERRYILADPNQCTRMGLYPPGHPSVRHSSFDWTNVSEWENRLEFQDALVQEVVLTEGDVLYLPTNWFHFIENLSLNYQCNARSGTTFETTDVINACGFKMGDKQG